ncbi:MAG: 16S rRNA (guanine(527)-N(7))-methyltransferase RsmG [Deltaproteobacteria bacterium]|nr:16S rRNA (guanine(527)-N(7))-methyltransferase RsmG [Deltaproteobacteria bacterium]
MNKDLLHKGALEIGLSLSNNQLSYFHLLFEEMKKWGDKINITSLLNDEKRLIEELFIDSLAPLLFINKKKHVNDRLLDIGSGGGFPGLPIQIGDPSLHVTLTDSIEKKIFFIRNILRKLDLHSAGALCMRFGSGASSPLIPLSFDWATSKAVTHIDELSSWAHPFLKSGAYLICLKTPLTDPTQPAGFERVEEFSYLLPFNKIKRKLFIYKKI